MDELWREGRLSLSLRQQGVEETKREAGCSYHNRKIWVGWLECRGSPEGDTAGTKSAGKRDLAPRATSACTRFREGSRSRSSGAEADPFGI